MSEQTFKYVGTRPIRHDGLDKVTGRAKYAEDYSAEGTRDVRDTECGQRKQCRMSAVREEHGGGIGGRGY